MGWIYLIIFLFILWIALERTYPYAIPSLSSVALYIEIQGIISIARNIFKTLENTFLGFALSFALAMISLIAYHINLHLRSFIAALNTFIQSISVLVWSIIFVIIYGVTSGLPPIFVVSATSYPILLSIGISGMQSIEGKYRELFKVFGAKKRHELLYLIIPGTLPYLIGGSRAAIGSALRITVVAEALGASGGIGYMLLYSYDLGYKQGVFAWSILLVLLMILLDEVVLKPIEGWSRRWMN
ncbi:MAG: ABC transporter permease [Fervidicoccus fontis]|nr:MAG: ABC transporter permease [Fervidicoccus fontis]